MSDEKDMLRRAWLFSVNGPEPGFWIRRTGDYESGSCEPKPDDPGLYDLLDAECDTVAGGVCAGTALGLRGLLYDLEDLVELARKGAGVSDEAWTAMRDNDPDWKKR